MNISLSFLKKEKGSKKEKGAGQAIPRPHITVLAEAREIYRYSA
jgi:hypothetical protein